MRISLPHEQLKIFLAGLQNLADAVKQGKGNITDEKLMAIFEYIGLKKNEETIKQAKSIIKIFKDILKNTNDKQQSAGYLTSIGIPIKTAESVVDILLEARLPMKPTKKSIRLECPACNNYELESLTKGKLCCIKCGATFLKEGDKYKLLDINDKTSLIWVYSKNLALTYQDWQKLKSCGYHVHYDAKTNSYVPYVPDSYSEKKPSFAPDFSRKINDVNTQPTKKSVTKLYKDEASERKIDSDKSHSDKEENKLYVTSAGKFLLDITIDDLVKARDILKRFEEEKTLNSEELAFLLKNDLLDEKSGNR